MNNKRRQEAWNTDISVHGQLLYIYLSILLKTSIGMESIDDFLIYII